MFTPVLDILIFFAVTTAIVGHFAEKFNLKGVREAYVILGLALAGYRLFDLHGEVSAKQAPIVIGFYSPLSTCLEVDMVSIFMTAAYIMLGIFVVVYSIRYMERETRLTEFYVLVIVLIIGMIGVVSAGDFLTLFLFWEAMCLAAYVLVAFRRYAVAIEASFKFLVMSGLGTACLLIAMSFLYGLFGTLNFAYLSALMKGAVVTPWILAILALIIIGFGVEAAIVPLHTWLPDAHPEAPSSISALLSGVVIQTGLYALSRVLFLLFRPDFFTSLMSILAVVTMTVGNIIALLQDDIKRLLAYSSIAQMGYMLIGLGIGSLTSLTGTFLHVFNHALLKGLAFLVAGALWHETGTRSLAKLKGVGRYMPVSTMALSVSFIGLVGAPPTNGFISKFLYLFRSAIEMNMAWLAVIGMLNSIFSVGYYLRVLQILFATPTRRLKWREAPVSMLIPMIVMAFLIFVFGIYPEPIIALSTGATEALLNTEVYVRAVIES